MNLERQKKEIKLQNLRVAGSTSIENLITMLNDLKKDGAEYIKPDFSTINLNIYKTRLETDLEYEDRIKRERKEEEALRLLELKRQKAEDLKIGKKILKDKQMLSDLMDLYPDYVNKKLNKKSNMKTKVKKAERTEDEIQKDTLNYLEKCSKHLFKCQGYYYKFIPLKKDGKNLLLTLKIGPNSKLIREMIDIDWHIKIYKGNAKNVIKNKLFNQYLINVPLKSVKNFKYMKLMATRIKELFDNIELDYNYLNRLSESDNRRLEVITSI